MRACYKNDPEVLSYRCAIIVEEVFLNKKSQKIYQLFSTI